MVLRRHALTVELPPTAALVLADPIRLTQVLTNLLDNACKYTPEGGRIVLSIAARLKWWDIVIADNKSDRVFRLRKGVMTTIGFLPSSETELQNIDMVVDPSGIVVVANDENASSSPVTIHRFDPSLSERPLSSVTTTVDSSGAIAIHSSGLSEKLTISVFAHQRRRNGFCVDRPRCLALRSYSIPVCLKPT